MKLSNLGLAAFYQTALKSSMTAAAEQLGLTQSALSQRILGLEDELETALFIRDGRSVKLTEAGERLLSFCHAGKSLEDEFLDSIKGNGLALAGPIRIAGYSSVMRSVILPALADFLRANPKVEPDFRSYEVIDLPDVLRSQSADMIVLDYVMEKRGIGAEPLGEEEYVVIRNPSIGLEEDIFLDHGPHDNATSSYFAVQKNAPKYYRRSFMGDVYGIIDGVEAGLGKAVMSKHLLNGRRRVKIERGYRRYSRSVTLHYHARPYYPRLFQKVKAELVTRCPALLKS